jgi:hypothetical protein
MRLAAQLSLSEPGGTVLLAGRYAACARQLSEIANVTCILVDGVLDLSPNAVNMVVADRLPLVDRALRGAAVAGLRCSSTFLVELGRCIKAGGRLVTPASTRHPAGVRVLAEDDAEMVFENQNDPFTIQLRRAH